MGWPTGPNEFSYTISNTDAQSIELHFQGSSCGEEVFVVGDCCTAGAIQNPNLGFPGSANTDLYYQTNTFDGLDIQSIEVAGDCAAGSMKYTYGYDLDHRVTSATHEILGANPVSNAYSTTYGYDPAGNIQNLTRRGRIDPDMSLSNSGPKPLKIIYCMSCVLLP